MALMLGKLYAALKLAEVPDPEAREAAEEAASYENRLASLDGEPARLGERMDRL